MPRYTAVLTYFFSKHAQWLEKEERFPEEAQRSNSVGGRPKESFCNLSATSKRKRTKSLRESTSASEIGFAHHMKLREEKRDTAATVVRTVVDSSPRSLQLIHTYIQSNTFKNSDGKPKPFSPEEALAHKIQCRLSKAQYNLNRNNLATHNYPAFPPYRQLVQYKTENCFPHSVEIAEGKGRVPLEALLHHTVTRIMEVQYEVMKDILMKTEGKVCLEMVSKVGFDGSTNHSRYHQRWVGETHDDGCMVLTSLVPLLVHRTSADTQDKYSVVWLNQRPSSTAFCRPWQLEYAKETDLFVREKMQSIEEEIVNLNVTVLQIDQKVVEISHRVLPTMIDGKVSSSVTGTSAQTCNVCKATPKHMNNIDQLLLLPCDDSVYRYGLSVLHANLRFLDYALNLAYRLDIKKAYTKYTAEEKESMATKKRNIQNRFKNEMGLLVDKPSTQGGNTNTGNVARRFFGDPYKVSQITGLDVDILIRIRVILRTLSSGFAINVHSFKEYCLKTARDLVSLYGFYYMPSAVHSILLHGADFISAQPVPIGMLSEEALESEHKELRYLRLHSTRKTSRRAEMHDLFHELLVRTDPVIASLRKAPNAKGTLDTAVRGLLIPLNPDGSFPQHQALLDIESEASEIDDE